MLGLFLVLAHRERCIQTLPSSLFMHRKLVDSKSAKEDSRDLCDIIKPLTSEPEKFSTKATTYVKYFQAWLEDRSPSLPRLNEKIKFCVRQYFQQVFKERSLVCHSGTTEWQSLTFHCHPCPQLIYFLFCFIKDVIFRI